MEARLILSRWLAALVSAALLVCTPVMAGAAASTDGARFEALVSDAKSDMMVDPARAIGRAKEAYALAVDAPTAKRGAMMRATALWLVGEAEARLNSPKRAIVLLTEAERIVAQNDPSSLTYADVTLSLGAAMTDLGQVTDSLVTLQRAHRLYLALHQARGQAKALILIALLYSGARDKESALHYFQEAIDTRVDDDAIAISLYIGRGTTLGELGQSDAAERSLQRASEIAHQMGSDTLQSIALGNLATVQLRAGNLAAAERTVARGMSVTSLNGAKASRPAFVVLSSQIAFKRGHFDAAERLIAQRFSGIDLSTTTQGDRDAHQIAYDVYHRAGDAAWALPHLAALKRLDDQATEIARSNSAALAAARFDYANQELRIAKLKADDLQKTVAFERSSARAERTIFLGAGAATLFVIMLLGVGLFTIRRSRNQTRSANVELEATNTALNKALAAKTEFLATTSHEIRTPLNGILGMTQVMAADLTLDNAVRERVAVVHGAGVTMRALVDDILDVAKIESGRMTIEDAPFDLASTVDDASRLWREQATAKGLSFTVAAGMSMWIMGDAARLRQIVFNLLSNAVKFTANGHVRITCTAAGGRAQIAVEDTGIGIDPAAHELIFEMFRQADATTTRQFGGTGLGLSICRSLARGMGGDVRVHSSLGEGAVFTLDLPIRAAENPAAVDDVAVVVVERNPIARATLRAVLEPHGTLAFVDTLLEAEAVMRSGTAETLLVDHASIDGDIDSIAAVAARGRTRTILLLPADAPETTHRTGVISLRRPIGKKSLVSHVFYVNNPLVRDAA